MHKEVFLHRTKMIAVLAAAMFCFIQTIEQEETTGSMPVVVKADYEEEAYESYDAPEIPQNVYAEIEEDEFVEEELDYFVPYEIPEEYVRQGGSFPVDIQKIALQICEQNEVPYSLVVAMIEVESAYQPDVVSSCGAVGYMQVCEKWHHDRMAKYGLDNVTDPEANILVGVDYMAELLKKYPLKQALVVYNTGSDSQETSAYAEAVVSRMHELEEKENL